MEKRFNGLIEGKDINSSSFDHDHESESLCVIALADGLVLLLLRYISSRPGLGRAQVPVVYLIRGGFDAMRNNPNVCPDVERSFEATMATVLNTLGGMFPESTVRLSLIRKMSCRHTAPADNAPEKSEMN